MLPAESTELKLLELNLSGGLSGGIKLEGVVVESRSSKLTFFATSIAASETLRRRVRENDGGALGSSRNCSMKKWRRLSRR